MSVGGTETQHGFLHENHVAVSAFVEEAGAGDAGGDRFGDVVGGALEAGDLGHERGRERRGLEESGRNVAEVDAAVTGLLVEGVPVLLDLSHAVAVQAAPLHVHRVDGAGGGDRAQKGLQGVRRLVEVFALDGDEVVAQLLGGAGQVGGLLWFDLLAAETAGRQGCDNGVGKVVIACTAPGSAAEAQIRRPAGSAGTCTFRVVLLPPRVVGLVGSDAVDRQPNGPVRLETATASPSTFATFADAERWPRPCSWPCQV